MAATISVPTVPFQLRGMLTQQTNIIEGRDHAGRAKLTLNQAAHIPLTGEADVAWI